MRFSAVSFVFIAASPLVPAAIRAEEKPLDTSLVRSTDPLTPEQERAALRVPDGFEVQLFASEPMINKPINIAFDAKGRLWVSSTYEYPYAAPPERWGDAEGRNVKDSRDGIFILEDTDGDGRADKKTVFADGLNIPTGVLPYKNGCIAWSVPNIWYFEDTDGDDVCDKRTVLFGPLGWERDVHGNCSSFRLGPDGWVYGTHGFSNTSHFKVRPENLKGAKPGDPGTELTLHSGNVYRFLPDGSRIEIFSWGQVNPFGIAEDAYGNLYTADCHSAPIYQLIRGSYYPSFGKPHDGLGFGPVMMQHDHSSTGICGIVYLKDDMWGPEWNDRILIGNVVTSRVNQDRVSFNGSTPVATEEPDFIRSDDPWFRPVDLRVGPDNALYVADFYNRIIGHYEVPLPHPGRDKERGRIWRIVKKDAPKSAPKPAMNPVAALRWEARAGAPRPETLETIGKWLESGSPFEKRAAVEALYKPVGVSWIPRLVNALKTVPGDDPALRHQLRIVIREHLRLPGAFATVKTLELSPELRDDLAVMARTVDSPEAAAWVFAAARENPGDPGELAATFTKLAGQIPSEELAAFARSRFENNTPVQAALLDALVAGLHQRGDLPEPSLMAWGASLAERLLAERPGGDTPAWQNAPYPGAAPVKSPWGIQERNLADVGPVKVISSLPVSGGAQESLTGVLRSKPFPAPKRFRFALCGHSGPPDQPGHDKNFARLVDAATGEELARALPPRDDTARVITWELGDRAGRMVRFELADGDTGDAWAWIAAGRFETDALNVEDFERENRLAEQLEKLAQLLKYSAPPALREQLAVYLPPAPPPPPAEVTPEQREETDKLIAARAAAFATAKPDPAKGRAVFTAHCAVCHAIGGEGALVGPQLDGIGNRGAERLIEDILDPNRNVDAHFRLHIITKTDGEVFAGIHRGEAGQTVIGVDAAGKEHRIPKNQIASIEETGMSIMPAAFAHSIPEEDFNHLLAWLLTFTAGK